MITLSAEERRKFSLWLQQDADGNKQLIEQMGKVPAFEPVVKMKKQHIAAALIVAAGLDATEEVTL